MMPASEHTRADQGLVERAWSVLESVPDPEIPVVSIRELGILRDVMLAGTPSNPAVEVIITPTYSGCPAMGQIAEDVEAALRGADIRLHSIRTVLAPAWTTDWITAEAREKLRAYGIAPPSPVACASANSGNASESGQVIRFMPRTRAEQDDNRPACPQCGSATTERISEFGSTACKALYRCLSCREPFDYFKPY